MKINLKNISIFIMLIQIVFLLIIALNDLNYDYYANLEFIGKLAIINLTISLTAIFLNVRKVDFFFIFISFCYLFSFGQSILFVLKYPLNQTPFSITNHYFSSDSIFYSSIYILFAISLLSLGYCFKIKNIKKKHLTQNVSRNKEKLRSIGWIILFISFIPTFYLLYLDIIGILNTGYIVTSYDGNILLRLFSIISGFFPSSLIILYIVEDTGMKRKILYVVILMYFLLQLLGGSRIEIFRLLVVFYIISYFIRKTISKKNIIFVVLTMIFFILIFTLISNVRNYMALTSNISLLFSTAFKDIIANNFLFKAIEEMGITQIINTLVFDTCPNTVDYELGASFLRSLYNIFPNFLSLDYRSIDTVFSPYYNLTSSGLGASIFTDLYWNFGYFSFVIYLILGAFFKQIGASLFEIRNSKDINYNKLFFVSFLMYVLIFWVRTDCIEFGRTIVYYGVIPIALTKIKFKPIKQVLKG